MGGILADHFGYNIPYLATALLLMIGGLVVFFGVSESFSTSKEAVELRPLSLVRGWKDILGTAGVSLALIIRFLSGLARMIIVPIAPLFVVSLIVRETDASNTYAGLFMAVSAADIHIWRGLARQHGRPHQPPKSALLLFAGGRHILCAASACRRYLAAAHLASIGGDRGRRIGRFAQRLALALCRHRARRRDLWAGELGHVGLARGRAASSAQRLRLCSACAASFLASAVVFALIALTAWYLLPARHGRAGPPAINTGQVCLILRRQNYLSLAE